MSFNITIQGTSQKPHTKAVRAAVKAAVDSLRSDISDLANLNVSGYSVDSDGQVTLTTPPAPAPRKKK